MVYWAALATFLFYAANVPLCFAVALKAGDGLHFGFGLAAFRGDWALVKALETRPQTPKKSAPKAGGGKPPARLLLRALWELLRRVERLRVRARIGTGDAAETALACGALRALFSPFADADIAPSFDKPLLELSGIIEIRAGNIIRAVALAGVQARPKERKSANGEASH